tara:strand:+ start:154 stop:879 length:726 start_codon:yes stop_codon:yes gene_type:complete
MSKSVAHAFILAAGMGKRMMPLTKERPKPMVEIFGQPIIGHILDHLKQAGVTHVTVNGYYKAEVLKTYLETRDDLEISFSEETELLDTGGGLMKAMHTMPDERPFYIINGDAFWTNPASGSFVLKQLADFWDETKMDLALCVEPIIHMAKDMGVGDYQINSDKRLIRALDKSGDNMFTGIRITDKRLFADAPKDQAFSFMALMDEAQKRERLYGLVNPGRWYHLSTPEDLLKTQERLDRNA